MKGLDHDTCAESTTNSSYNKFTIHSVISIYTVIQFLLLERLHSISFDDDICSSEKVGYLRKPPDIWSHWKQLTKGLLKIIHGTTSQAGNLTFFSINILMVPFMQTIDTKI